MRSLLLATILLVPGCIGLDAGQSLEADSDPVSPAPMDSTNGPGAPPPTSWPSAPTFRTLKKESNWGDDEASGGRIATDPVEWRELWNESEQNREPKTTPPPVDFQRAFVAAQLMGWQRSGGYDLTIKNVTFREGTYRIGYETSEPGSRCAVTLAITSPYHMIEISRVGPGEPKPEFVRERHTVHECP